MNQENDEQITSEGGEGVTSQVSWGEEGSPTSQYDRNQGGHSADRCGCPLDHEQWGIVLALIRLYRMGEKMVFRVVIYALLIMTAIVLTWLNLR